MKDELLNTMVELGYQHAKRILVGSKAELMPSFVLETEDGIRVHGCPWRNDSEKELMVEMIRHEIREHKVKRYSFLCEAWALELKNQDEFHLRASQDPRRYEVVIALAVSRDGREGRQWRIERNHAGRCTGLTADKDTLMNRFESWLTDLLPPK
jgi:hypothetical protein